MKVGDRIKVRGSHTSRGNHTGEIVEPIETPLKPFVGRYCVKFDRLGAGIQQRYLFLDERDFTIEDKNTLSHVRTN